MTTNIYFKLATHKILLLRLFTYKTTVIGTIIEGKRKINTIIKQLYLNLKHGKHDLRSLIAG